MVLTRERAGFEVRDVHPTHYGRVCPIETPEGPNIGLINSLATMRGRIDYGFLETPYRRSIDGKVTTRLTICQRLKKPTIVIAQASAQLNDQGKLIEELVPVRHSNEFTVMPPERVDYMDVHHAGCVGCCCLDSVP